ncbi:MAG: hypothetical protein K2L39_06725 [Muribaculaceae bacterium]|nr:hypothetical protein [Muribaculaceae bacterium]
MWQVAAATGWSVPHILDKVNYQTLVMMLSDAPRYVGASRKGASAPSTSKSTEAEAAEVANYFRSNLRL